MQDFHATVEEVVPVLQPGLYQARFAKISEEHNDTGEYWLWTFVARDGDNDVEITATTSPRITPKTKSGKWLAVMFGKPMQVGDDINFADILDMPVQIIVVLNDSGYSRIEQIMPMGVVNHKPEK